MQSIFGNLKVGSLVEIEILNYKNEMIKLNTIVEEVIDDSNLKLFAPIYKGASYPFHINQDFTLITTIKNPTVEKYEIFSCRCRILSKERSGNIFTITINRTSEPQKIQRRDYFRLPIIKNMTVIYNNNEYELLSKDLSGNGIRGYLSRKIPAGSDAVLLLAVDEKTTIEINMKVIECSRDPGHQYRYDFRATFPNLNSAQLGTIMRYIFSKQSNAIKKQLNFDEYVSIVDSDKTYSDFFSMTNIEKIIRITPIALWSILLIQYAYLVSAFRDKNMGINFFFNQLKPTFKPDLLIIASSIAYVVIIISIFMLIMNYIYNRKKRLKYSISHILQIILSIITIIIHQIYT